ncbi:MAG: arylamine N-acetyltransferase [Clostridia bacterium]|nr:arylamine N-acetyltransferase [Clostridia bacterium]
MNGHELIRMYFDRLAMKVPDRLLPDAETLAALHRRHVLLIPYENTDYLTGHILPTGFETQFHEVIIRKRGGMCIDMNPLFGALLTAIGYRVRYFSTVICGRRAEDLNYHVILLAEDREGETRWCDVANPFTRFFDPLPVTERTELTASGSSFRFGRDPAGKLLLQEKKAGIWTDFLRIRDADITEEDRNDSKFSAMTEYPENAVCRKEVFSLVTPEGRRTLTGNLYRESTGNGLYQYECPDTLMPWAYAQFGLQSRK